MIYNLEQSGSADISIYIRAYTATPLSITALQKSIERLILPCTDACTVSRVGIIQAHLLGARKQVCCCRVDPGKLHTCLFHVLEQASVIHPPRQLLPVARALCVINERQKAERGLLIKTGNIVVIRTDTTCGTKSLELRTLAKTNLHLGCGRPMSRVDTHTQVRPCAGATTACLLCERPNLALDRQDGLLQLAVGICLRQRVAQGGACTLHAGAQREAP